MLNQFTPEFKGFIAFVFILVAYAILGFNQVTLNKEINNAVSTSDQAVFLSSKSLQTVKTLVITPTVTPTATPSAIRINTPAKATKITPIPTKK